MNRILLITLLALLACMKDPPKRTERTPSTDSTPSVCDELTVSEVRMALTLGGDAKNWCNESCVKQHCKDNEDDLLVKCRENFSAKKTILLGYEAGYVGDWDAGKYRVLKLVVSSIEGTCEKIKNKQRR